VALSKALPFLSSAPLSSGSGDEEQGDLESEQHGDREVPDRRGGQSAGSAVSLPAVFVLRRRSATIGKRRLKV
jgi:hypothetical protein